MRMVRRMAAPYKLRSNALSVYVATRVMQGEKVRRSGTKKTYARRARLYDSRVGKTFAEASHAASIAATHDDGRVPRRDIDAQCSRGQHPLRRARADRLCI